MKQRMAVESPICLMLQLACIAAVLTKRTSRRNSVTLCDHSSWIWFGKPWIFEPTQYGKKDPGKAPSKDQVADGVVGVTWLCEAHVAPQLSRGHSKQVFDTTRVMWQAVIPAAVGNF